MQALTADPFVFFPSNTDSGYSVDNQAPGPPFGAQGVYGAGGVALHWEPSGENDVMTYRLYRGEDPNFGLSEERLISAQADTGYFDATGGRSSYYKLTVVDTHDNESPFALVSPPIATGISLDLEGAQLVLHGARPTPATRENLEAFFTLTCRGPVELEVLDATGRRVAMRQTELMEAGRHSTRLAPPTVPGVYLVRLSQGADSRTSKEVVLE